MVFLMVSLEIKPEAIDAFVAACQESATHTWQEPGNIRFDLFQETEPTKFILIEVYDSPESQKVHLNSAHFTRWRETTANFIVKTEVRSGSPVFPESF